MIAVATTELIWFKIPILLVIIKNDPKDTPALKRKDLISINSVGAACIIS